MDQLRQALQADLITAMKAGDRSSMGALRSAISALANAEAVPAAGGPVEMVGGPAEVPRRELTAQQVKLVLHDLIEDRRNTVGYFGAAGRHDEAAALQHEIEILERYLYLTEG